MTAITNSSIIYKALTSTTETLTMANETLATESTTPWHSQDDNASTAGPDPILIVATLLAVATCVGGVFATVYHIRKYVNNNNSNNNSNSSHSHSKAPGAVARWFRQGVVPQKARHLMTMASGPGGRRNTKQPVVGLPRPWAQQPSPPLLVDGSCWMYSLLDESSEADHRSPVYRPLTVPLVSTPPPPSQQQQHQVEV